MEWPLKSNFYLRGLDSAASATYTGNNLNRKTALIAKKYQVSAFQRVSGCCKEIRNGLGIPAGAAHRKIFK
jgi:hypothetical protein